MTTTAEALRLAAEARVALASVGRTDLATQAWNAMCPQGSFIQDRHVALVEAGYQFAAEQEGGDSSVPTPVFTWDYREQPPLGEILAKAREMPGPWFWFSPETGSQEYALILSDHAMTAAEAERVLWESVEG